LGAIVAGSIAYEILVLWIVSNASQTPPILNEGDLVAFATMIPAQLAGVETAMGTLAKGLYVDLLRLVLADLPLLPKKAAKRNPTRS
jgi:hypothetical protein